MHRRPAWYKGRQVGGQFACTKDGGGRVAAAAALLLAWPCHCDATADPPMQHCHAVAAALQYSLRGELVTALGTKLRHHQGRSRENRESGLR